MGEKQMKTKALKLLKEAISALERESPHYSEKRTVCAAFTPVELLRIAADWLEPSPPLVEQSVVKEALIQTIREIDPYLAVQTVEKLAKGLHERHYAPSYGIGSRAEYLASSR